MKKLIVTFTCGSRPPHVETIAPDTTQTYRFGRHVFAKWFELAEQDLRKTVSGEHFRVCYDATGEHFKVIECSSNGSGFRHLSTGDEQPAFVWRHREELLLGPHSELRIYAPAIDHDIHVTFRCEDATGPGERPPLLESVCQNLDQHHGVHLVGLPGSGKQQLLRELVEATGPGIRPSGPFAVRTLPIVVDCLPVVDNESQPLWRSLARAILTTSADACRGRAYSQAASKIEGIRGEFDRHMPNTPVESLPYFERTFRCVREETFQNPLLILTHFDGLYADLEADMLYCLARFRSEWHQLSDHIYVIISTNRPAAMLRVEDTRPARERLRREFDNQFAGATLSVRHEDAFGALWKALHPPNSVPLLSQTSAATLARLTGNLPAIAQEAKTVIGHRRWLNAQGELSPAVEQYHWDNPPLKTCIRIWQALEPPEQKHLLDLAAGRPVADDQRQRLYELGLLTPDGHIFSGIFARTIIRLQASRLEDIPEFGLYVDTDQRRVYYNGQEVFARETRESRFFWALYEQPNEVVTFLNLLVATNNDYNVNAFKKDSIFRIHEQETLTRLAGRVKQKIGGVRIVNVHGKGYKFLTDAA